MTEIAALGLRVDGADGIEKSASALDHLTKSADSAEKAADRLNKESGKSKKALDDVAKSGEDASGSVSSLAAAATRAGAIIGAAFSVSALLRYADSWSDMTSLVRVNIGAQENAADVMSRLSDIARMTYSSMEATSRSFATNAFTLNALGKSTQQQLDYTEALNNALVVSGAKGQQFEMVQNSLNRAMAEGSLRGTELQNVLNYGSRVAGLLADELGADVTELRALAAQGEITGEVIYSSLTKNMELVREEAETMPETIGDAFTLIRNAVMQTVGVFDQQNSISETLAKTLISVADNMGAVVKILVSATAGWVAYRLAVVATTTNLNLATIAQRAFNVAAAANPYVLGATAIVTAATAAWTFRDAIYSWIDPVGAAEKKLRDLKKAQDDLTASSEDAEIKALTDLISAYEKEMDDLAKTIAILMPLEDALQKQRVKQMDDEFMRLSGLHQLNSNLLAIRKAGRREVSESTKESAKLSKSIEETIQKLKEEILVLEQGERALFAFKNGNDETALALYDQAQALKAAAKAKEEYTGKLKTLMDNLYPAKARVRELTEEWNLLNKAVSSGDVDRAALNDWLDGLMVPTENLKRQLKDIKEEADPLAQSWQAALERIDSAFVDLWKSAFNGFKDFADSLKNAFIQLIAELAHRATTQKILVSLGLTAGGTAANAGVLGGSGGGGFNIMSAASWASAGKYLWSGFSGLASGSGFAGFMSNAAFEAAVLEGGLQGAYSASSQISGAMSKAASAWPLAVLAGMYQSSKFYDQGIRASGSDTRELNTGSRGLMGDVAWAPFTAASYAVEASDKVLGSIVGNKIAAILTGSPVFQAIQNFVGGALFGGKYETTRGGIQLGFDESGFDPLAYERQTKKGGLFGSTKRRMIFSDLDEELDSMLNEAYGGTVDGVRSMFESIGVGVDDGLLEGVRIAALQIGTSGKSKQTQEEIEEQIAKWFSDLQEAMVGAISPGLTTERLTSLSVSLAATNAVLGTLGLNLYETSIQGAELSERLLMASGGLEQFAAGTDAFFNNFYTASEQFQLLGTTIRSEFDRLGLSMPTTQAALRNLVSGLDLTTDAGMGAFNSIMGMSDALGQFYNSLRGYQDAITGSSANLTDRIIMDLLGDAESQYNYLKTQADLLATTMDELVDPSAIAGINQEITRLYERAYGLLDDRGRQQVGHEFLEAITENDRNAQEALVRAQERQSEENIQAMESMLERVGNAIVEGLGNVAQQANLNSQQTAAVLQTAASTIAGSLGQYRRETNG